MRRRALGTTKRMPSGRACPVGLCYDVRLWAVTGLLCAWQKCLERLTTESSLQLWQTVDSLGLRHDVRLDAS
jgi:hypothetical protein